MRSTWLWLAPAFGLGLGVFGGCGGSSDGSAGSGAGTTSGGSAGSTGIAGTGHSGAGSTSGGTNSGGTNSGGASSLGECDRADCGPQLGLPNWTCADGRVGGPTGRCLERPGGTCGWEINDCPMVGEGGASSRGGQGNASGDGGAGGASEDCGGCSAGKVCVFQAGGPGPGRFLCATQNPCGNAAACACIVGQGTCQPDLMGDPPRYCACDNGSE